MRPIRCGRLHEAVPSPRSLARSAASSLRACRDGVATGRLRGVAAAPGRDLLGRGIDPRVGIDNIEHLIFVVQENRSFDHYFGTFPGADGIPRPRGTSSLRPGPRGRSLPPPVPRHELRSIAGGRTTRRPRGIDVDGGKMDGFIVALQASATRARSNPDEATVRPGHPGPNGTPDVMGYHTAQEIPNYWTYAEALRLQDRMFAPADSWTLPAHLFLVSGWSATCADLTTRCSCRSDQTFPGRTRRTRAVLGAARRGAPSVRVGRHHLAACTTTA